MEDVTLIQLKDELRRRKMKTTDIKADMIKRLQTAILYEVEKDNSLSDDEMTDDETDNKYQDAQSNVQTRQTMNKVIYDVINRKFTC